MPGSLQDGRVVVADEAEASTIHNKGTYGTPRPGGGLVLALVEAAYLVELGRLEVEDHDLADLLVVGTRAEEGFGIRYLVYRDLRTRGFVVTLHGDRFRIYPRGASPKDADAKATIVPRSERADFALGRLAADLRTAEEAGRGLLYALVDEESDLTYYLVETPDLTGDRSVPDLPEGRVVLLGDRAVVPDPEVADRLHDDAFLGRLVDDLLQVSLVETAHLQEAGFEVVDGVSGDPLDPGDLRKRADEVQPDFGDRYRAYEALRDRGLLAKTGFKYGTHFRVYRGDPEEVHAELLVHVLPHGEERPWQEVAGFVRMAHSVRKTLVFLSFGGDGLEAVALSRARP